MAIQTKTRPSTHEGHVYPIEGTEVNCRWTPVEGNTHELFEVEVIDPDQPAFVEIEGRYECGPPTRTMLLWDHPPGKSAWHVRSPYGGWDVGSCLRRASPTGVYS